MDRSLRERLTELYRRLLRVYGPQNWWPIDPEYHRRHGSDPREEIVIGAILTQNTSWRNAERAIENLKRAGALSLKGVRELPAERLGELVKPAGFFRRKVAYLREVAQKLDPIDVVEKIDREQLLRIRGIGRETADVILLYAGGRPFFVVDSYTKRIVFRTFGVKGGYEELRRWFEGNLPPDVELYREFHALLDEHAKRRCLRNPLCGGCPVEELCGFPSGNP